MLITLRYTCTEKSCLEIKLIFMSTDILQETSPPHPLPHKYTLRHKFAIGLHKL